MGVLERISKILGANVNDLLDRAEDPEATLNQIIRDMEVTLQQAGLDCATQLAQQKLIQSDLELAKQQADAWRQRAQLTGSKEADDLAREHRARLALYQTLVDAQTHAVDVLSCARDALRQKHDDAARNRDALISRAKRAQARITQATARITPADYI